MAWMGPQLHKKKENGTKCVVSSTTWPNFLPQDERPSTLLIEDLVGRTAIIVAFGGNWINVLTTAVFRG